MNRIKLPGKDKNKKIVLIILVVITIGVLLHEYNMNSKNMQGKSNKEEQQEVEKPIGKEEEINKNVIDESKKDVSKEDKENNKEKKNYSKKENDLYNDAYTLFFSHDYTSAINKANELISEFPE